MRPLTRCAFVSLVALVACVTPRTAPIPSLPFATDTARAIRVADGVTRWHLYAPSGPWAIHALVVDRDRCWEARAVKGRATPEGRTKTSEMLRRLHDTVRVIGGVNGDFFTVRDPQGIPTNAHVSRGQMLTPPNQHPVIAFDSSGAPWIGRIGRTEGRSIMEAVGGRPSLIRDGVIVADVDTVGGAGFATTRHPRTAAGIARGGRRLILAVIDGRQKPYSDGMTLRETASLMLALGARDAINLDGGGSTTMVADSAGTLRVVNRPSDPTGERAVGNALAIVSSCHLH